MNMDGATPIEYKLCNNYNNEIKENYNIMHPQIGGNF